MSAGRRRSKGAGSRNTEKGSRRSSSFSTASGNVIPGAKPRNVSDGRTPYVRVKTAKGRKLSSKLWLERQLNDPYVAEAKRLGYRGRAAFKLIEINEKYKLLYPGCQVVDLGCAPGGWSQVAVAHCLPAGRVIGMDILATAPLKDAEFIEGDFMEHTAPGRLKTLLQGAADLVMSDMAAPTTGHGQTDHLRIMVLAEAAYMFAAEVLAPGGHFIAKVFSGGTEKTLLDLLKKNFQRVHHFKPPSSRKNSAEMYVIALGFHQNN